jgi:hypothetical protein
MFPNSSVADPHHVDADPNPDFKFDAEPDPTFYSDPDQDLATHFPPDFGPLMLQNDPLWLPPFHFDANQDLDPDSAFHFPEMIRIRNTAKQVVFF